MALFHETWWGAEIHRKTTKVSITGDGHLDIAVSDKLDVKILGDGKIEKN